MLPRKPRHILYVTLLVLLSLIFTSAVAKSMVGDIVADISMALKSINSVVVSKNVKEVSVFSEESTFYKPEKVKVASSAPAMMFATIITGADDIINCSNDGIPMAYYNLCGDFDNRIVALQGSYNSYEWQQLNPGGGCTFNVDNECSDKAFSCWGTVSSSNVFNINASAISSSTGAGYRVRVNGTGPYYYFNVKKSTITQKFVKRDFLCGTPGRIQITNLSSAYEYSINDGTGFGPWQGAIFDNLEPNTYVVKARLQNTPNSCEYLYDPIKIEERDMDIEVTYIDASCSGDTGSISVSVKNVPGPYKYSLLDANGIPQEFTSFIAGDNYVFRAVGFGTYSVQVETPQCMGDAALGIAAPTQSLDINGNPIIIGNGIVAMEASTEVNTSFGCDVTSVDIIIKASGGTAPYTYQLNGTGPSSVSFTDRIIHPVTQSGSYNFVITDSNGCTIPASAHVEELTPPNILVNGIDGNCINGGAKLNFTVVDAKGYNLSFRSNPSEAWSSNPLITVPAGIYSNIQVRYQQGGFSCVLDLSTSVTVTTIGVISGNAVKISDRTCDGLGGIHGGTIEFQGPFSGGSGAGYVFSIFGDAPADFTTQTTYSDLKAGIYTPIIRDGSGCRLELDPITIADIDPPTAITFAQNNMNCALGTADVELYVTSNYPIAKYEIIAPAALAMDNGNSPLFSGLNVATAYQFKVTDSNGCSYTSSFTPANISTIRARVKSGGDFRVCSGASDGTGIFLIDGFANNYTYSINGGSESDPQSGSEVILPPSGTGTYVITVTDVDTGCTDSASITIESAPTALALSRSVTDMSCANNNIGRVVGVATGGWGGYQYTLTPPSGVVQGPNTGTFGNLSQAGQYVLTVTDSEGCTASVDFTLTPLSSPTIAIASADYCYSATNAASVSVTSSGGGTGHQYRINNGSLQDSPTFSDLVPGRPYTIEVVDDNNCSSKLSVTIPPQLQVSMDIATEIPCAGDGSIVVTVKGGNISNLPATTYTIFKDGVAVPGTVGSAIPSNPFIYTVPFGEHGNYTVSIIDNNGCTNISEPITLNEPTTIMASERVVGPSWGDTNSGFVEITPDFTAGIPPFQIKFGPAGSLTYGAADDPSSPYSSQTIYSGLAAGDYEYLVKDSRGCILPGIISVHVAPDTVLPPDATVSSIDATCSSSVVSGGIRIDAISNGSPEFTYIVEDLFGNQIVQVTTDAATVYPLDILDANIDAGRYRVITLDSRGCTDIDEVTVSTATVDIIPDFTNIPTVCTPGGFAYCVDIVGGSGNFVIRRIGGPWETPNGGPGNPRRHCFSGIQFGVAYTVEVRDITSNCIYTEVIDIPEGPGINVILSFDNVTCNGGDVALTYNVTGSNGSLDIEVVNLDTGAVIVSETRTETTYTYYVPSGPYGISVIDANGCADGDRADVVLNNPRVDIIENINANCNELGQLTVRGSGGTPYATGSPYRYAYMPSGSIPGPGNFTDATTVALPGSPAPGIGYDIWVRDSRDCDYKTSAVVIQMDLPLPTPGFTVTNQCDVSAASFTITMTMPGNIDSPSFTLGGVSQFGVYDPINNLWETVFTVNSIGVYRVDVMDANGCTSFGEPEVFQLLSASGGFDSEPNCEDPDGVIDITVDGGSGDFTYRLTGTDFNGSPVDVTQNKNPQFTGILPGNYQVVVTDNLVDDGVNNCTATAVDIISFAPVQPLISDTGENDISCNGLNDGSIHIALAPNTDADGIKEYNLYIGTLPLSPTAIPIRTNSSGSFTDLAPDTYVVEVVTNKHCTDRREVVISEPSIFTIKATAPPFLCETGANRYSTTTITATVTSLGNGGPYGYKLHPLDSYQTGADTFDFEIVDNGSSQDITVYAIDSNGCETFFKLPTINPPTEVVPALTPVSALDCKDPERVRIEVVGTTNFTVTVNSVFPIAPVSVTGSSFTLIDLPAAGDYLFEVTDNIGGCTYPLPKYTVEEPILPTVVIRESKPVQCYGVNDGALSIDVTTYTGAYTYNVYRSDDLMAITSIKTGTLNTADNPETITGLPGGNFYVVVEATGIPYCANSSSVATVRTPNGPLEVEAIEVGNVSCDDNIGQIVATASGGWDNKPYEYALLKETSLGSNNFQEEVPFGTDHEFKNLSSGNYRVVVRDVEGCEDTYDIPLDSIDRILAEIREPQGLVCPSGNNAILEAYDPVTGNAGASGGVLGAGYKYQLIYLDSNDINDESSRSGLQDSSSFEGTTGGFISAGWYAIEVSSSYSCVGITQPYYVNPPPPIQPKLVQVQAPGCGGQGQLRLSVENPELGFNYEYRAYDALPTDLYTDMVGSSILIDVGPGIYQYDIRKKDVSGLNVCNSVRSQGISLVNAESVELVTNLPDDISCASELDGRIESFAAGGVGNYQYTLYKGNPGNPFSPNTSAIITQNHGTFEGLGEGTDYYIGVTSGLTCWDVKGPMSIIRPDPIEYTIVPTPVSCNGMTDGSIAIEVTSGGEGLIQFAISPDFNKFFSDPDNPNRFLFTDLAAGTYEILIQDEKGCSEKWVSTIIMPEALTATFTATPETCINASDGSAQLSVTGGTPFVDAISGTTYYETKIIGPNSIGDEVFVRNNALFLDNLMGGETYVAFIRDAMGCETNVIIPIPIGVDLNSEAIVEYGCDGIFPNSTVTIRMTDNSLMPRLLFSLDVDDIGMANTQTRFGDLPVGKHTVYIYHENGCATSVEFTVDRYEPLMLTAEKTGPNEVTASAIGGFGGYEFFFQGESYGGNNVFLSNNDTNVTIRVVDQNGCEATISVPFKFTGMLKIPNFFTPNGDNKNDKWFPGNRGFFPNIEVKIYDRYGRVVARLDQVSEWDGTYEGKELPTGDYWYEVNANDQDKQRFMGHFTLYR